MTAADSVLTAPHVDRRLTQRARTAAVLCGAMAVATLLTALIGLGKLQPYQVALSLIGAAAVLAAGWWLLRSATRWPAVLTSWLCALGVIAELGDLQARRNDTGALGATNTTYFLSWPLWIYMAALIVLALLVTSLSSHPAGRD